MKHLLAIVLVVGVTTGCDAPTARDELGQMVDAQMQATIAAAKLNSAKAEATTRADATRQFLILQGQQTRIAQDAQATATTFAQNSAATATAYSAHATATSQAARATATAHSGQATATAQAAQFTATVHAQNVEATRVSASATATAHAASAQATRTSADATATVSAALVRVEEEKAAWNERLEQGRAVAAFLGGILFLLALAGFVAWGAAKGIDALVLRGRVIRDWNGVPFVISAPDRQGRIAVLAPSRMPGAVALLTPPGEQAVQIDVGAENADVTRRDQGIALVLATASVDGARTAGATVGALMDSDDAEEGAPSALPEIEISQPYESRPLNLENQPSRVALPIGVSQGREMWIALNEVTHALVGGPSGMGKSSLLHGWVQSLARGEQVDLALYDGKAGMEFARYAGLARVRMVEGDFAPFLADAIGEMGKRFELLRGAGVNNIAAYNRERDEGRLDHIVIVIDEMFEAMQDEAAAQGIEVLAAKGRAEGIHLLMATQLPDARSISRIVRINSSLRVAFACPSVTNSMAILGYAGAEKIEKTPGRLLVFWQGKLAQAQGFRVALPLPTLAQGERGMLPASALDDDTRRMVEYALREGGGLFVVTQIADALGWRDGKVARVARNLEKMGLLSDVLKDDGGQNVGRRVLPKLVEMVGGAVISDQ